MFFCCSYKKIEWCYSDKVCCPVGWVGKDGNRCVPNQQNCDNVGGQYHSCGSSTLGTAVCCESNEIGVCVGPQKNVATCVTNKVGCNSTRGCLTTDGRPDNSCCPSGEGCAVYSDILGNPVYGYCAPGNCNPYLHQICWGLPPYERNTVCCDLQSQQCSRHPDGRPRCVDRNFLTCGIGNSYQCVGLPPSSGISICCDRDTEKCTHYPASTGYPHCTPYSTSIPCPSGTSQCQGTRNFANVLACCESTSSCYIYPNSGYPRCLEPTARCPSGQILCPGFGTHQAEFAGCCDENTQYCDWTYEGIPSCKDNLPPDDGDGDGDGDGDIIANTGT